MQPGFISSSPLLLLLPPHPPGSRLPGIASARSHGTAPTARTSRTCPRAPQRTLRAPQQSEPDSLPSSGACSSLAGSPRRELTPYQPPCSHDDAHPDRARASPHPAHLGRLPARDPLRHPSPLRPAVRAHQARDPSSSARAASLRPGQLVLVRRRARRGRPHRLCQHARQRLEPRRGDGDALGERGQGARRQEGPRHPRARPLRREASAGQVGAGHVRAVRPARAARRRQGPEPEVSHRLYVCVLTSLWVLLLSFVPS